jgi:hypothetical protein
MPTSFPQSSSREYDFNPNAPEEITRPAGGMACPVSVAEFMQGGAMQVDRFEIALSCPSHCKALKTVNRLRNGMATAESGREAARYKGNL